jgi:hypothetical protein
MLMLQKVLEDPIMSFTEKIRHSSDFIAKLGLLHSKAHVQKRLADLAKSDDEAEDNADDDLEVNPLAGTSDARGRRKA